MANGNGASAMLKSNLLQRIITAVIGVPIILFLLSGAGHEGASFFALGISSLMLFEFCEMVLGKTGRQFTLWIVALNLFFHFLNYWLGAPFFGMPLFILGFLAFFLMSLVSIKAQHAEHPTKEMSQNLMAAYFGWIYCGVIPLFVPAIRSSMNGDFWIILCLFIVWATDIGGYVFGKWIGKHKLFPEVSPKKTWEGALGGLLLSYFVTVVAMKIWPDYLSLKDVIYLTAMTSIASQFGDLCESVIKRSFGVKDSGQILPGHGGFLDRFDGVLFALPVMYAYLWLNRL